MTNIQLYLAISVPIAFNAALTLLMATLISSRISDLAGRISAMENRLTALENRIHSDLQTLFKLWSEQGERIARLEGKGGPA